MKFKLSKEFQIGILVIVTIAITFFGVNYLKGINIFNPTNNVYGLAFPIIAHPYTFCKHLFYFVWLFLSYLYLHLLSKKLNLQTITRHNLFKLS